MIETLNRAHRRPYDRKLRPWTTKEQAYVTDNYVHLGPEKLGRELGRTTEAVRNRAYLLRKDRFLPYAPPSPGRPRMAID